MFWKKISVLFFILQLIAPAFYSQEEADGFGAQAIPTPDKDIQTADAFFNEANYKQALYFYLRASKTDSLDPRLMVSIGECYLNTSYKKKSLPYFEKAVKLDSNVNKEINLYLGRSYQYNLKWEQAIEAYKKYLNHLSGNAQKQNKPFIDKKIKECLSGMELESKPVNVEIKNLGKEVNSPFPDYTPIISADESVMFFTSKRPFRLKDSTSVFGYENIFTSINKNGEWERAMQLEENINVKNQNNSNIALSIDGQKMMIYKESGHGDFYETTLDGKKWTNPVKIEGAINSSDHESAASISFDGKTIYFVSDRSGGIGGRDIYRCTIDATGKYGVPENLGPEINTPFNEDGVCIHPDGKTLYFNSQGHNSMGGYDIFKTVYENGKWSKPQNLGYPVNTPDDDVFFVISANGKNGYYSSVKEDGYGETDIYCITWIEEKKPEKAEEKDTTTTITTAAEVMPVKTKAPQLTLLKGIVSDDKNMPIEADIEIVDNTSGEMVAKFKSNSATGNYVLSLPSGHNYGIAVNKEGYLFHSENFDIPDTATYMELNKPVSLKKVQVGNKIVLNNIFFAFNKSFLNKESTLELKRVIKLLKENPAVRVEISGHTDNKGSTNYNQKLSEERAKAVVNYLVEKGISKSRLQYKGYGSVKPVADNDTPQNRKLNRRTEFEIIE